MKLIHTYRKDIIFWILAGFIIGLAVLVFSRKADATYVPKVDVCHFDGQSGNFQTLNIAAVAAAVHLNIHEQDYEGECEEVEPTVTPEPTVEVTPTPEEEEPTPTVEPEVTVTPEPTVVVTETPQQPSSSAGGDGKSDGRSDGRSDGSCSQKPCVINQSGVPLQPPSQSGK